MASKKEVKASASPKWFYCISIVLAYLFTMYISVYSAIHFDSIRYMNIVVVFLFMTSITFFLISGVHFHLDKMGYHVLASVLYFAGMAGLIVYGYNATDASDIVRYSMIYTIFVVGISLFVLLPKEQSKLKLSFKKQIIGNNFNFRIYLLFPNKQITTKSYEY